MGIHREILEDAQAATLESLAPVVSKWDLVLGGGTAIALRLGHRRSFDLDWFRYEELDPDLLQADLAANGLQLRSPRSSRGTLMGTMGNVPVGFYRYRYPDLRPAEALEEPRIRIASLEDLAAMKLAAVAQRVTRRDFLDVHALLGVFGLEEMFGFFRKKYGRDAAHLLYALTYFDEADREPMPDLIRPVAWEAVKRDLRDAVKRISDSE
jgi:hypothetical protein